MPGYLHYTQLYYSCFLTSIPPNTPKKKVGECLTAYKKIQILYEEIILFIVKTETPPPHKSSIQTQSFQQVTQGTKPFS